MAKRSTVRTSKREKEESTADYVMTQENLLAILIMETCRCGIKYMGGYQVAEHTISIKNCNNIISTDISLTESTLNIKFGYNGTGKSTICEAIRPMIKDCTGLCTNIRRRKQESIHQQFQMRIFGLRLGWKRTIRSRLLE